MRSAKGSICLLLAVLMFFTACSDAQPTAELPGELSEARWGESAAEIMKRGSVTDCALIRPGEFAGFAAIEVLNFDSEASPGMGGYAFRVNDDNIREVFQTLKARLTERYGEPQGSTYQTADGQKPENWEQSLSITDSFQVAWSMSDGLCYLTNAEPGYMMVSFLVPGGSGEDTLGDMPWGLTLENLNKLPNIEQYSLVRTNVSLWEHSARLVYRFDEAGGLFAAHYEFNTDGAEDPVALYKSLLMALKDIYGEPDQLVTNESGGEIAPARTIADVESDGVLNCADSWGELPGPEDKRVNVILQLHPDGTITLSILAS